MQAPLTALTLLSLCGASLAAPADPVITAPASLKDRSLISDLDGVVGDVLGDAVSDLDLVFSQIGVGSLTGSAAYSSILSAITPVSATVTQTAIASCFSTISSIHSAQPSANPLEFIVSLVAEGLTTDNVVDALDFVDGVATGESSSSNLNTKNPDITIYPQKACGDAPYSVDEGTLRAAIYIPSTFTYGAIPPVILIPGTGCPGYFTFEGNFIPLLTGTSYADIVWLNIPTNTVQDVQVNSEYVAYAINYISAISKNQNVSTIAWSQGNLNAQWSFKYWPSTAKITSNHIAISPDYAGTTMANLVSPLLLLTDPATLQQRYMSSSNFITTLRSNDGDSAYVPTTVLYSGLYDEIVEPQQGTGASAYLLDARGVGVTNNEVQTVCPGLPGGSFYTHEGLLANPIAFALAKDALTNGGPGQLSRIDTTTLCNEYLATGLNLADFLLTENAILISALSLVLYEPKVLEEPAISAYALSSVTTCSSTSTKKASSTKASTTSTKASTTSTKASTTSTKISTSSKASSTSSKASSTSSKSSSTTTKKTSSTTKASSTTPNAAAAKAATVTTRSASSSTSSKAPSTTTKKTSSTTTKSSSTTTKKTSTTLTKATSSSTKKSSSTTTLNHYRRFPATYVA